MLPRQGRPCEDVWMIVTADVVQTAVDDNGLIGRQTGP